MKDKEPEEDFENDEEDFWEEGAFIETSGPLDKGRMKTFHKKHDEDMNFNCKECNKKISAHNRDWHNHMCDDCFNRYLHNENRH